MLRIRGSRHWTETVGRIGTTGLVMALGLAAGGCSTDFRRLENPSLTQGERPPLPTAGFGARRNAGAPIAQENWPDSGARAALPPVTSNPRPAFDAAPPSAQALPNTAGMSKPFDRPKLAPSGATGAAPAPVPVRPVASGQTIDVQPGDSLFAIAKRHNVSIASLMDVNGLKSPNLKPGQKLALPASSALRRAVSKPQAGASIASAATALPATALPPSPAPAAPTGEWSGTYTLKSGDSLYAIARQHKVSLADLQRNNNIADATKVRPGVVLKVPGSGGAPQAMPAVAAMAPPKAAPIAAAPTLPTASATSAVVTPKIINIQPPAEAKTDGEVQVAAVAPTEPKVAPATQNSATAAKFRWPVKGPILANFGKRPDGSPNDGIKIGVPAGTDVHAAGDGVVAYSGSELKGYGNLVLVRHEGGWVTAYAHASDLLVKRGDTVKRGQVIAKSGQSGGVDKPQVHFELRKDSQPVDPAQHLDKQ